MKTTQAISFCEQSGVPVDECVGCQAASAELWPIWENPTSSHSIGYIVSSDRIPGLPYPRIGEVYQRPRGWAAWPIGHGLGDDEGPRSKLGFRTRRDAVEFLVQAARTRVASLTQEARFA